MPNDARSLALAEQYALGLSAIATDTAKRVSTLWFALIEDEADGRAKLRERVRAFGRLATPALLDGQAVTARASDAFVAAFLSYELDRAVRPIGLDVTEFQGLHDSTAPIEAAFSVCATTVGMVQRMGYSFEDARRAGATRAKRLTRSEVIQSGRDALAHLIETREVDGARVMHGWKRMTSGSRPCVACLARADGRVMPVDAELHRHPGCSCVAVPVVSDVPDTHPVPTGEEVFRRLTREEQDRAYGAERAAAIREGEPLATFATIDHGHLTEATKEKAGA